MTYDLFVPPSLLKTQTWFAKIITQPLIDCDRSQPTTPEGESLALEASEYIAPSPTMQPHERIELYNQQYWWRLCKHLQTQFPLLTRLFGQDDFNESIAVPYLLAYPPQDWFLGYINKHMCRWIEECYTETDLPLILRSAQVDYAFDKAFFSKEKPSLSTYATRGRRRDRLLKLPLSIQPHMTLLSLPYHLISFREKILKKEPEHWLTHKFPKLEKKREYYFVVYRNSDCLRIWEEISEAEYLFLSLLQQRSITDCCELIEKEEICLAETVKNLEDWMCKWTAKKWLAPFEK